MKRKHDIKFAVIDHLRLVRAFLKYGNKFDRMEFVTGELKALAKELKIAIIILTQVSRSSQRRDDPFPAITDIDGGGSLEQDSDWGLTLFRRERYIKGQQPNTDPESNDFRKWVEEKSRWKDRIEIRCVKRRRGPDGETREFIFDGARGMIRELDR